MENILKQEMLEGTKTDIKSLKVGDVIELKDSKYAKIISDGEEVDDIDYGMMYKNIKRFEFIDWETYNILSLTNEGEKLEKEIKRLTKEKAKIDLALYFRKRRIAIAYHSPYGESSENYYELFKQFRNSESICRIEDIGTFFKHDNNIMLYVSSGYNSTFYILCNIDEKTLLEIKQKES